MKPVAKRAATIATIAIFALPALAFLPAQAGAQVYYYAPGTTSGAYNYDTYSYIPAAAMPYVNMGYQMQQQSQQQQQQSYSPYSYPSYNSYSYPTQYQYQSQSQSQSQYQTSYPSYNNYMTPTYGYSNMGYGYSNTGEFPRPQSVSYPSGTVGPFGTQLCYWSDYPVYAPCNQDPQQWIQDPYTGMYY